MSSTSMCDLCGFSQKKKYPLDEKNKVYHNSFCLPDDVKSPKFSKSLFNSFDFCYGCSHKFAIALEHFLNQEKEQKKMKSSKEKNLVN